MLREIKFMDGDEEKKVIVKNPTPEDLDEADRIYSSKIAEVIKSSEGQRVLTRSDIDRFLRDQGLWTDQDEKEVEYLNTQVSQNLDILRKGGIKLSEGRKLAIDIADIRRQIADKMSKRQTFDDATVESLAEAEKREYFVYACTVDPITGDRHWDSFGDMKNDRVSEVYRFASVEVVKIIFGYDPEFEKNLPENKWLKKHNMIDEDLYYVHPKTGEKVDRDGRNLEEVVKETEKAFNDLQGDIEEETPYIDDYEEIKEEKPKRRRTKKQTV